MNSNLFKYWITVKAVILVRIRVLNSSVLRGAYNSDVKFIAISSLSDNFGILICDKK